MSDVVTVEDLSPETAPGVVYDRYLKEGKLAFQRCTACDKAIFFPRVLCPACGSDQLRWEESAGTGTVYSTTTNHPRNQDPVNISLIDVDEGFRMMSSVVGTPAADVTIGLRVKVQVETGVDEPRPLFVKDEQ